MWYTGVDICNWWLRKISHLDGFSEAVFMKPSYPQDVTSWLATTSKKFRFTTSEKSRSSTSGKCRSNHHSAGMRGFHVTCCSLQICRGWQLKKQLNKIDKIHYNFDSNLVTFWTSPIFCSRIGSEGWKWKQMRLQHTQLCNMLIDRKYSIWLLCFSLLFTKCFPAIIAFACCLPTCCTHTTSCSHNLNIWI